MTKTITIEIDAQGNPTITTSGFAGRACRDATRDLERALGQVQTDRDTPEMHQTTTTLQQRSN
jgi:hypothetical protein